MLSTGRCTEGKTIRLCPRRMKILYWLRNDLRVHDNEVLAALPAHAGVLLLVYCFDPATHGPDRYLGLPRLGPHRLPFLLDTLADLQRRYAALGSGIQFIVGNPATELPQLVRALGLSDVWMSAEHLHEETTAETDLAAALGRGVSLRLFETLSLLHPHDLPIPVQQLPLSFSKFRFDVVVGTPVRPPLPGPRQLPPLPAGLVPAPLPVAADLATTLGLPAANGQPRDACSALPPLGGGETAALVRLHDYVVDRRLLRAITTPATRCWARPLAPSFRPG